MILDAENVNKNFYLIFKPCKIIFKRQKLFSEKFPFDLTNSDQNREFYKKNLKDIKKNYSNNFTATFTFEQYASYQWTNPWRMLVNLATSELATISCIVLFLKRFKKYSKSHQKKSLK